MPTRVRLVGSKRALLQVVAVALLAVALGGVARAAEPGDAKARYMSGQSHYNLNEFSEALQDFKEAYRLHPDPAFLFNIAQCERQLGDFDEAIKFYRSYLRNKPDASNAREVQKKIDELRGLAEAKRKSKEGAPQSVIPPTTAPPDAPPPRAAEPPPVAPLTPPPPPSVSPAPAPTPALTPPPAAATSTAAATPGADLTASPTPAQGDEPLYKKWWLWAGAGAVVVAVVVVAVVASSGAASAPSSALGNKKVF